RVSPTEIEEVIYSTGLVGAAAAIGVPHPRLGQAIMVVATPRQGHTEIDISALATECRRCMPQYMVPLRIVKKAKLPMGPNGKIDRKTLAEDFQNSFVADTA